MAAALNFGKVSPIDDLLIYSPQRHREHREFQIALHLQIPGFKDNLEKMLSGVNFKMRIHEKRMIGRIEWFSRVGLQFRIRGGHPKRVRGRPRGDGRRQRRGIPFLENK
jgi:hypothetical protein